MNKGLQIGIIVVCLGAAAYLLYSQMTKEKPGSLEGARATFFICVNPSCKKEYSVEPGENLGGREPWECPDCGQEAADAARCPACGRMHQTEGHGRYQANCPHCGEAMPPLQEQLRGG